MARLNIEDSIYADNRFAKYMIKKGSKALAIGNLVLAWRKAQDYYLINGGKIPKHKWEEEELDPELISCGFAIDEGDFIYVKGSKDNFDWLKQKREAGKKGGIASGNSRRSASIENINKLPKQTEANGSETNPLSPSPSPSLSPSLTQNTILSFSEKTTTQKSNLKTKFEYSTEFEEIYKTYPRPEGKKKAWLTYKKEITNPERQEQLKKAIKNYSSQVIGKEREYIKQFSTFMNNWEDYLNPINLKESEIEKTNIRAIMEKENYA